MSIEGIVALVIVAVVAFIGMKLIGGNNMFGSDDYKPRKKWHKR